MKLPAQIKALLNGNTTIGESVEIHGWVRTKRDSKAGFSFIHLYDGSCFDSIQVVADQNLDNYSTQILPLSAGSSLSVSGTLVESQGKNQSIEIHATQITVLGQVDEPESYPIAKKRHSFEYLRSVAHLRPRTNTFGAITRLRSQCALSIHQYFHRHGFFWVNTPIITASDCEGAGELFRVSTLDLANIPRDAAGQVDFSQDFFGTETFLTVSGQLNVEAYCLSLSRVYTFGPTFRAENSNTSRHLAEFWMIEPEIAFANLADNITLAEDFLKTIITDILENCDDDIRFFNQHVDKALIERLEHLVNADFERIEYTDAINILQNATVKFEFPIQWGVDLQSEHERFLTEQHIGRPVVIMNYPETIKAFYMRSNDDGKTCAAMDILVPGIGELIGGSQREERLDILDKKMTDHHLPTELAWYRDLRRYGTVPHAGFGLGFERLLNYITGMENIRDTIPYPRVPNSAPF